EDENLIGGNAGGPQSPNIAIGDSFPKPRGPVIRRGHDARSVRAERGAAQARFMSAQGGDLSDGYAGRLQLQNIAIGNKFPQPRRSIMGGGDNAPSIGAE